MGCHEIWKTLIYLEICFPFLLPVSLYFSHPKVDIGRGREENRQKALLRNPKQHLAEGSWEQRVINVQTLFKLLYPSSIPPSQRNTVQSANQVCKTMEKEPFSVSKKHIIIKPFILELDRKECRYTFSSVSTRQLRKCSGCLNAQFVLKHEATNPETFLARGQITTLNWHLANYGKHLKSNSWKQRELKATKAKFCLHCAHWIRCKALVSALLTTGWHLNFLHSHITSVSFP